MTRLALISSLAVLLGYIEQLFAFPAPVAGIKLGLGNIAVLIALFTVGGGGALAVSGIKVALCALLFGGGASFLYSLGGAALSLAVMWLLKKTSVFGIVGVSAAGGIFHNAGQLICAAWLLGNPGVFYYMPALALTGAVAGALTGVPAGITVKYLSGKLQ